jgi:two-component system nitrogen regulation sensor histidine kinase NtrY
MNKNFALLITAGVIFFSGFLLDGHLKSRSELHKYQRQLERHVRKVEQKAIELLPKLENSTIQMLASPPEVKNPEIFKYTEVLTKNYTNLILYKNSNPILWTNNIILPDGLEQLNLNHNQDTVIRNTNGYHYVKDLSHLLDNQSLSCILVIALKLEFNYVTNYKERFFPASDHIPSRVNLTTFKTNFPVFLKEGKPLVYLQYLNQNQEIKSLWVLLLWLIGMVLFLLYVQNVALTWGRNKKIIQSVLLFFSAVITIYGFIHWMSIPYHVDLILSNESFHNENRNRSAAIGGTLLGIILIFWLLLFTFRQLRVLTFDHIPISGRFILAILNYISIFLGIIMIINICKVVMLSSNIPFDFDSAFNLSSAGFVALLSIILFLFVFFIVSQRMIQTIQKLKLPLTYRLAGLTLSFLPLWPLFISIDPGFPYFVFVLVGIVYGLLFDLYAESKSPNLIWAIVWLIVFAGFSSVLLFKYNKDKDWDQRLKLIPLLLDQEDSTLHRRVNLIFEQLDNSIHLATDWKTCSDSSDAKNLLKEQYLERFLQDQYIQRYYNADIFIKSISNHPTKVISIKDDTQDNEISLGNHTFRNSKVWSLDSIDFSAVLFVERKSNARHFERVSPLHNLEYKSIELLEKYSFAIYNDGILKESYGYFYDRQLMDVPNNTLSAGFEWIKNNRSELVWKDGSYTILIGRELLGIVKPLSLFSLLFALLISIISLLLIINNFTPILPKSIGFNLETKASLKNRIQFSILALIFLSFIFVGGATIFYFNSTSNQADNERLLQKAFTVQQDAYNKLKEFNYDKIPLALLHQIVHALADLHKTDIHLFNSSGRIIHSSDMALFENALASNYIDPKALIELKIKGGQIFINSNEQLGRMKYKSANIPIYLNNPSPSFYISLPFSSAYTYESSNVKDFMSTLLNVYVLLLLISGVIALIVSNSITQPISVLGEKLKAFSLGKRNEPIIWSANDELGALINEYNFLINKLEKSAEVLAQNEREVAWREMAKQVAHEIKNPLTPMKLSIQYLEHKISQIDPSEIQPLVRNMANTLIEQIDNLNRIASEFSNFSKLPKPQNEPLILNDLIATVHDLFRKREDITFNLYVPIDEIYVYADRSHILRILNNLLKNAIQAIPSIRKGKIDIKLYTRDKVAVIQVSDNGSGIAENMQDKVFYPNFTTKSSGTGLGLAICKDMAEAYGGRIYFHTTEHVGTDFYIELPLMKEDQSVPDA